MRKLFAFLLLIALMLFNTQGYSQSYIGLNAANYAGVIGATLHPASIEDYPKKFDMVFLGINAFGDNNFGRVSRDRSFLNFNFGDFTGSLFRNDKTKYATLNTGITLPSFMFKTKRLGTIGFIARVRSYANADNVSAAFSETLADSFENSELFNQNFLNQHFDLTITSWQEYGITWAKEIKRNKHKRVTLGVTPKLLIGNGAAFATFQADTLNNIGTSQINIAGFNLAYGYSSNLDDVANSDFKWKKGNKFNFGLDIGIEYTHYHKNDYQPAFSKYLKLYRSNNGEKGIYKYKLSFSLLDIGRIKYNHGQENAQSSALLNNITSIDINSLKGTFDDPDALRDSLNNLVVLEDLTGTYTVGLPTTLQAGIDYHLKGGAFINTNLGLNITGLKGADFKTHDLSNITITPRWENHWLGFHAPIYANFKGTTNLGFGMRVGPLAFGISDILPFVSRKEVTSGGAYIVFKTYIRHKKVRSNVECGPEGWKSRKKKKK